MRGPAFFAYADNYLIDVKFGVIMDVEASRAIRQAEVGAAKTMIERTEERFDIKPKRLAADTAYGSGPNLNWLVNDKDIAPHIPVIDKSKREDGTFSREDFTFDKERNVYICPAGKTLTTTGKLVNDGETLLYRASTRLSELPAQAAMLSKDARGAKSRAASTRRPVTLPGRWPRPRRSSNHVATGSVLRCCLRISSASCGSAVCDCADRAVHSTSSRSRPSHRTCAGSPSWSSDHHQRSPPVRRKPLGVRVPTRQSPRPQKERGAIDGFKNSPANTALF